MLCTEQLNATCTVNMDMKWHEIFWFSVLPGSPLLTWTKVWEEKAWLDCSPPWLGFNTVGRHEHLPQDRRFFKGSGEWSGGDPVEFSDTNRQTSDDEPVRHRGCQPSSRRSKTDIITISWNWRKNRSHSTVKESVGCQDISDPCGH